MWNITQHCSLIIGCSVEKIVNQCMKYHCITGDNETYRKNEDSEGNSYTLIQEQVVGSNTGQYIISNWKKEHKTKLNLHTGQYADSFSFDHIQEQVLVEPLSLLGVTRHMDKFLCEATQMGSGLAIHTTGLNCNWLKVVIPLEVIVFLAFCCFSLCCCKACLSGTAFVVAPSKSVHVCCTPY